MFFFHKIDKRITNATNGLQYLKFYFLSPGSCTVSLQACQYTLLLELKLHIRFYKQRGEQHSICSSVTVTGLYRFSLLKVVPAVLFVVILIFNI